MAGREGAGKLTTAGNHPDLCFWWIADHGTFEVALDDLLDDGPEEAVPFSWRQQLWPKKKAIPIRQHTRLSQERVNAV